MPENFTKLKNIPELLETSNIAEYANIQQIVKY